MSLDYRTAGITDKTNVYDKEGNLTGVAQTIIFACLFVELSEITEENAEEFHKRISLYEFATDPLRQKSYEPVFVTLDEVKTMIGLRTNVPEKTFAQFKRGLADKLIDRVMRKWERAKADAKLGSGPKGA